MVDRPAESDLLLIALANDTTLWEMSESSLAEIPAEGPVEDPLFRQIS
jgi:hypothetical protein